MVRFYFLWLGSEIRRGVPLGCLCNSGVWPMGYEILGQNIYYGLSLASCLEYDLLGAIERWNQSNLDKYNFSDGLYNSVVSVL